MTIDREPAYAVDPEPVGGPPVPGRGRRRRRIFAGLVVVLLAVAGVAAVLVATGRIGPPAKPPPRVARRSRRRARHRRRPGRPPRRPRACEHHVRVPGLVARRLARRGGRHHARHRCDRCVLDGPDGRRRASRRRVPERDRRRSTCTGPRTAAPSRSSPRTGRTSRSGPCPPMAAPRPGAPRGPADVLGLGGPRSDVRPHGIGHGRVPWCRRDGRDDDVHGRRPARRVPGAVRVGRRALRRVRRRATPDAAAVVVGTSDGSTSHQIPVFGPAAVGFAPSGPQVAFIAPGAGDRVAPLPLGPCGSPMRRPATSARWP